MNKTYSLKPSEINRKWLILDATEAPLGRLATVAASLLIGKGKPSITAHIDGGDYVIVINADNLIVTGNKMLDKKYYRHSQYPGGLKTAALREKMANDSTQVIFAAIRGMLPVNKLRDGRLARLKIYPDDQHKHEPQKPETISLKSAAAHAKKGDK